MAHRHDTDECSDDQNRTARLSGRLLGTEYQKHYAGSDRECFDRYERADATDGVHNVRSDLEQPVQIDPRMTGSANRERVFV